MAWIFIAITRDFNQNSYRVVLPVVDQRADIDMLVKVIKDMAGTPNGPIAVRHIRNNPLDQDEGLRLVWPRIHDPKAPKVQSYPTPDTPTRPFDTNGGVAATGVDQLPEQEENLDQMDLESEDEHPQASTRGEAEMADWVRRDLWMTRGEAYPSRPDVFGWSDGLNMAQVNAYSFRPPLPPLVALSAPSPMMYAGSYVGSGMEVDMGSFVEEKYDMKKVENVGGLATPVSPIQGQAPPWQKV
ncbi:hypothetical protein TREMEDRAFT_65527 [Tremella mesenterica DSM 1558]|uniref:uncharacterized protein n=1 Tax=Tremella mesenterica (strain ATCC 24925 / CBS 8224 / DSM 1558 / NBRC 9311 / NRRL Y-6157 / RJB 2259-6 / UBC 559-6) TaxID=578456 RepID=UPI00032C932F|nr:uncharacterized protein TREMEDRAFT_65527 [Tremella mesenterica DSM 1558]EIW66256.1 hypothetical protein TREMEDRAFT_65527 [Tremella mesenterica DSM 1558]